MRQGRRWARVVLTLLLCAMGDASTAAQTGRTSDLWGDLSPGPHAIGYRALYEHDLSRPELKDSFTSGSEERSNRGRAMQISVRYPAATPAGAATLNFGDYIAEFAQEVDFATPDAKRRQTAREKFMQTPVELGADARQLRDKLPYVEQLKTSAVRDAHPASGVFPLVLFPAHRSPAEQSILAEFLASHGYVVAATTLKGRFATEPEISLAGLESQVDDLRFVMATLRSWPQVDRRSTACMGVGINATTCVALATRDPELKAVVSLEGGILAAGENRMLRQTPYWDPGNMRAPVLAIYAPHPSIKPETIDGFKYASRYFVFFPQMSEFHFLNYGMLEPLAPGIAGKAPGDTRKGFTIAAYYVRHFLEAFTKGRTKDIEFVVRDPAENGFAAELVSVHQKAAQLAPPTLEEWKDVMRHHDPATVVEMFRSLRSQDQQPLSPTTFATLIGWLGLGRDEDFKLRTVLAGQWVETHPKSARSHFSLAQVTLLGGDKDVARAHYREALRLLPGDYDPTIDLDLRAMIRQTAREKLQTLGEPVSGVGNP